MSLIKENRRRFHWLTWNYSENQEISASASSGLRTMEGRAASTPWRPSVDHKFKGDKLRSEEKKTQKWRKMFKDAKKTEKRERS